MGEVNLADEGGENVIENCIENFTGNKVGNKIEIEFWFILGFQFNRPIGYLLFKFQFYHQ